MAYFSISPRGGNYCCQVRWYPMDGAKRKSKNKTFKSKAAAKTWGKTMVAEIEAQVAKGQDVVELDNNATIKTLGELIRTYLEDEHITMQGSRRDCLNAIIRRDIAHVDMHKLTPKHIVDYCKERIASGVMPSTACTDITYISSVLKSAHALYDVDVTNKVIVDASPTLHALNLIGRSRIRSRRPTTQEIDVLRKGLKKVEHSGKSPIPHVDIFDFSILSCMRIGETCKILWEDLNEEEAWVWVRDRKDPRKKVGNHMKVPLLNGALDIIKRQPITDDPRVFPFRSKSVSVSFQRVRDKLGIEDLRYHDLRREGASRLFEQGYSIDQVAQVTGHRNINTLWRIYTDLHPDRVRR